jgi:hypothetical protein
VEYLEIYDGEYSAQFGLMEPIERVDGKLKRGDSVLNIRSTGYGVKVFLGLIMSDRMAEINHRRRKERESIGFTEVRVEELPEDEKNCPICQEHMGINTTESSSETAIKLVICCGQVFGLTCMRVWLGDKSCGKYNDTCPTCRFNVCTFFKTLGVLYIGKINTDC